MEIGKDYTFQTTCPGCGTKNDGHMKTDGDDGGPEDGSISVCLYCHTLAIYQGDGLRLPSAEELRDLQDAPEIQETLAKVRQVGAGRGYLWRG